ncbi:TIGR02444 family protein [Hyphococcus sp.]|uniref:TIGR02444 family protein n=1 Tax=Hyphococcus sp. TaxID=2038636 RepID=UPI0035C66E97
MSKPKGHRFWRWSLNTYELPGVKNRLIYLQDDFGFDVNLALWCVWRASEGETLSEDALRAAIRATTEWADGVVEPLREARINAHEIGPAEFYTLLKEIELAGERHEQDILFKLSRPATPVEREPMLAAARDNIALYASLMDAPRRDGFSSALLRDLIDHIFPDENQQAAGQA